MNGTIETIKVIAEVGSLGTNVLIILILAQLARVYVPQALRGIALLAAELGALRATVHEVSAAVRAAKEATRESNNGLASPVTQREPRARRTGNISNI